MNSDLDDFEDEIYDGLGFDPAAFEEDCDEEYVDYEKHLKDVTDYLKEEHPAIYADMILKDIIK